MEQHKRRLNIVIIFLMISFLLPCMADDTVYDPSEVTVAKIYAKMYGDEIKFFSSLKEKLKAEIYSKTKSVSLKQWSIVNLRNVCNMGFEDKKARDGKGGWTDDGPQYDLHPFKIGGAEEKFGRVNIYGVPFEIINPADNNGKSLLVMRSGYLPVSGKQFPQKVSIPVNQKFIRIYFLHGASYATTKDGWGASRRYELIYSDGTNEKILLVVKGGGHGNIDNWMQRFRKGERPIETMSNKYVPILTNPADWRYLYTYEFENPYPEKEIKQINVISDDKSRFTIIVLAITGVKEGIK